MAPNTSGFIHEILKNCMHHSGSHKAVVVFDQASLLAKKLTKAYREVLPNAEFIDFESTPSNDILLMLRSLSPMDLVVLIQSTSFRFEAFRIRVELFNRSLKVIEHPHLSSMQGDLEAQYYIESLAYDSAYYQSVGPIVKQRLDQAKKAVIDSHEAILTFESGFEDAKLNIGDYSGMKNIGGQFPIGEVFTEARNLEAVNGQARIFAFGDTQFKVNTPKVPITLIIQNGRVVDTQNSIVEFDQVLANIRADEKEIWVRELGFGLNRSFTKERLVSDIGTYERMCGVHLSLGAKHSLYKKPNFTRKDTKHHVDVFLDTKTVTLDGELVYNHSQWKTK